MKPGQRSGGFVVLSSAAPEGGANVALSSSNGAVISVGHDIHFNKGQRYREFQLQAGTPSGDSSATVTATLGSASASGQVSVAGSTTKLKGIRFAEHIFGGQSGDGQLFLTGKAPSGGASVSLSSDSAALAGDGSVNVAEGSEGAKFHWTSAPVNSVVSVTLTASWNGQTITSKSEILPPQLAILRFDPRHLVGGASGKGSVGLYGRTGSNGATVELHSDNSALIVPDQVSIDANSDGAIFGVQSTQVTASTVVHVTASFSGHSKTVEIALMPVSSEQEAKLANVTLSRPTLRGGGVEFGSLALNKNAPSGGATISLQTSDPCLQVPASVLIPAASKTKGFMAPSSGVASDTTVTVSAAYNSVTVSATVVVKAASLAGIGTDPRSIVGGKSGHVLVALEGVAPSGGAAISLSSSDSSVQLPSTLTIPEGKHYASAEFTTSSVGTNQQVVLSATHGGVTKQFTLNLNHN